MRTLLALSGPTRGIVAMASQANEEPQRRVLYYSGRVQGVGFRYTARALAERYEVRGFVQNLADGRVLLVVEDVPSNLDRLVSAIAEEMNRFIRNTQTEVSPATGEFTSFQIRR